MNVSYSDEYPPAQLTPRMFELWRWIAEGYDNATIAEKMGLKNGGVTRYMERLRERVPIPEGYDRRVWLALNCPTVTESQLPLILEQVHRIYIAVEELLRISQQMGEDDNPVSQALRRLALTLGDTPTE